MKKRLAPLGVNFSHDGIHDSLTHLHAPTFFYEELNREISMTTRSAIPFSLIQIIIKKSPTAKEKFCSDKEILNFAEALKETVRSYDTLARLGVQEFVILVRSEKLVAEKLVGRVKLLKNEESLPEIEMVINCIEAAIGEQPLPLMNRLEGGV